MLVYIQHRKIIYELFFAMILTYRQGLSCQSYLLFVQRLQVVEIEIFIEVLNVKEGSFWRSHVYTMAVSENTGTFHDDVLLNSAIAK